MQIPLALLDSSAVEEVPIDLWTQAFDAIGWPSSLVGKEGSFSHGDLSESLTHDTPSDELLQLLESLHDLGTASGTDAINVAMNDRKVSRNLLPANLSAREFALHLYLAQRDDAAFQGVFARAQIQVQEGEGRRRYNEYMGKAARTVDQLEKKKSELIKQVSAYCIEHDLGEHINVNAVEDDGVFIFRILRSHHLKKPLAVIPGSPGRTIFQYRPVHCDMIHYDSATGLIRMAVQASAIVPFYREAFGQLLFGDKSFFTGDPVCTLAILQRDGRKVLEKHEVFGISRVRMTECVWDWGDRELITLRSHDCFATIEELGLNLQQGTLLQAKLKLDVIGRSIRPVIVNIRIPSTIEISQKSKESIVNQFLTTVGIRNSKRQQPELDFFSVLSSRHPIDTWRALFTGDCDRLIAADVLTKVKLSAVASPGNPAGGRVFEAHPLPNGDHYGVSKTPEIPSQTLTATDLDGWEFVPEKFRLFLRSVLGVSGPGIAYSGNGLLDLGRLEIGNHRIRIFYALNNSVSHWTPWAGERAAGDLSVILLPVASTPASFSRIPDILIESSVPELSMLVRRIVDTLKLNVPANLVAPDNAKLVVDTKLGKVWVNKVPIETVMPDSQPYKFIEILAKANGAPVSSKDLNNQLAPGRTDEDVATRQAKRDAKALIRVALEAAGQPDPTEWFPVFGKKMYRCALPAFVA